MNDEQTQAFIDKFQKEIVNLQKANDKDDTIDYITNAIEDLIIKKEFRTLDKMFKTLDIELIDIESAIAILTASTGHKKILTKRKQFYNRLHTKLNNRYFSNVADEILQGLK